MIDDGLSLVARHSLVEDPIEVTFPLRPGDRPLVAAGETLVAGARIAERLRDAHLVDVGHAPIPADARPGDRWAPAAPGGIQLRRGPGASAGELLFELEGRWRMAAGEHTEPVETPVAGVVRDVRPGVAIVVSAEGRVLRGVETLGDPTRGTLALGTDSAAGPGTGLELRPGSLHVGMAGMILVVGSRVDAEVLTRARAMGVRGVIVDGLAGKERRDFLASEARQRAALHRLMPFAVLVLEGAVRRPIASPIAAILAGLAGREVAIVADPPALVFDDSGVEGPSPDADLVRVRGGEQAAREGRWAGLAGLHRFPGGTFLEAAWVRFGTAEPVAIPLADLERFA